MEKFSNERTNYWNEIKRELLGSYDFEDFRFRYLEMGQLLSYGFSITQPANNSKTLILSVWDAEFDNERFDKGIFNLDRLAISNKTIKLNLVEIEKVKELLGKDLNLIDWGGIVLDGLHCQLELENKKLDWNCNEEINVNLTEFIELLRNKVV